MNFVRICPCGYANPLENFFCEKDGVDLTAIPLSPVDEPLTLAGSGESELIATSPVGQICHGCGFTGTPVTEETCLRCNRVLVSGASAGLESAPLPAGTTREPQFRLRFFFGEIEVNEYLAIGRDPVFSPIARHIMHLDRVSRRHAEIRIDGGRIVLRDNGSTNRVLVNGQVIAAETAVVVREGDEIHFSGQLVATVIGSRG